MLRLFKQDRIFQPDGIEVKESAIHGRGVFACRKFRSGAVIETAPLILLSATDKTFLQTTSLFSYYFLIDSAATPAALGLGYSSVYNHSGTANAVYSISLKDASLIIKACKTILPGEEITLNYNGSPDDPSPVYFHPDNI
ncbi:MAG: SET domain-containing protein-lysine N-methyltransferase [Ferruginibacter sp.]